MPFEEVTEVSYTTSATARGGRTGPRRLGARRERRQAPATGWSRSPTAATTRARPSARA
jgi:hypothetical protein